MRRTIAIPDTRGLSSNGTAKRLHDPMVSDRAFAIFFIVTILIALMFLLAPKASAATRLRNGTANNLNTSAAWDTLPGSSDIAKWDTGATGNLSQAMGGSLSWLGIIIGNPSGAVTIPSTGGFTLTLGTSGIDMSSATQNLTINALVALGATQTWNIASARTLTVAGAISGSGALTKTGAGTLTLSSSSGNSYSGGTTVSAGTLQLSGSGTLGSTSGALTVNGGTLDLNGTDQTVGNFTGTGGTILNNATGTNHTLFINNTGTGTYSGVIADHTSGTGTVALEMDGSGTITLSGANTYSGGTNITAGTIKAGSATALGSTSGAVSANGGTLDLNGQSIANAVTITGNGGGSGALINSSATAATLSGQLDGSSTPTIGGSGNMTISGQIIASGSSHLTKVGTGTVFFTNNTNNYTRPTDVNAGVLNIQAANALGSTSNGTTVASGAALQIQGGITTAAEGLTLNGTGISNDGALRNISGNNNYTGAITLGSATRINSDLNTLTLSGGISGTQNLTVGGAGNTTISSIIGTGSGTLTKDGTGTLTLTAANTYTGTTTVSAGILNIQNATALGTTANGTSVASGATLQIQNNITVGAEALTLNGGAASGQNGDLVNVSGTNTYGGAITLATAASTISSDSGTLNLTNNISNSTFGLTLTGAGSGSVSGVIGSGSGTLAKTGAGTWTLSGTSANTYTGLTTVSVGELDLGKTGTANAIGSGGLTINGGTVKYTGASTDEIANTANVTISGGTLDLNNNADTIGSLTFNSGTLTSTGGTQTLTLAGSTATTLQMQGAATIPTSVNIAFSSTTTSGVGMTFDASANGTATINGNINLNTTGTTGITRTFTINDGAAATDTTIAGVISNTTATGLTKAGAGTLVLTGANTYTGATTVNAGSLLVYNTSGSGTGTGNITVTGSGTTFGGGTTNGVGGVSGTVTVGSGANLAPSNSAGATGILKTGALTLQSGSNFQVDINGTAVGTGYDQLAVTGGVLHITGSNLLVSVGAAFTQSDVGDKFAILSNITAGVIAGGETFSGLSEGASFNSGSDRFMITYLGNAGDGTNGNDIVLTLTAVPEPSTWLAAALALSAVGYMQRRRLRERFRRLVTS